MVDIKEQLRVKEKTIQDLISKIGHGTKCSDEVASDITKKIDEVRIIEDQSLDSTVRAMIQQDEIIAMAEMMEAIKIKYQTELKDLKEKAAEELQLTIERYELQVQEFKN